MKYLAYAVATVVGLAMSYMGVIFALLGGEKFAYVILGLLLLAYAAVILFLIRQNQAGKGLQFSFVLALPMIIVTAVMQLFVLAKHGVSLLTPDSDTFVAECKSMGPTYKKLPSSPVRSIAYDWDGKHYPTFNHFEVQYGTRITSMGRSNFPHQKPIEFVERKRSGLEGTPAHGGDAPYVRFPNAGEYYAIPVLTADVLVHYRMTPEEELMKAATLQGPLVYEITVTDRRTQETLATLRYMIDAKQHRGCGLTESSEMNERKFVLRAIGLGQ
jgi:hypothetical protein